MFMAPDLSQLIFKEKGFPLTNLPPFPLLPLFPPFPLFPLIASELVPKCVFPYFHMFGYLVRLPLTLK